LQFQHVQKQQTFFVEEREGGRFLWFVCLGVPIWSGISTWRRSRCFLLRRSHRRKI